MWKNTNSIVSKLFCLSFLLLYINVFSQTISINIKDESGTIIKNAKAFLYESTEEDYKEFVLVRNGEIEFIPKEKYNTLKIEIASEGHLSEVKIFTPYSPLKNYDISIVLKKNNEYRIEEVNIKKRLPVQKKKDTVVYNVERFADGTEVKLEDILKKLPGIDVNNATGTISYKGKSIETITLNDDNLFDQNYQIGSRNINFDMVDQVEAIENYTENPVLVKVSNSDKVSLNVKLKKNILDVSGSVGYKSGFSDDKRQLYETSGTLVTLYNKLKSFTSLEYNNIGNSNSYNFSDKDEALKFRKVLDDSYMTSSLPNIRRNFNNFLMGSANLLYKFASSSALKINYSLASDDLLLRETTSNDYKTIDGYYSNISSVQQNRDILNNYLKGEYTFLPNKKFRLYSYMIIDDNNNSQSGSSKFNETGYFRNAEFKRSFIKPVLNITKAFKTENTIDFFVQYSNFKDVENQNFQPINQDGSLSSSQNIDINKNNFTSYLNYYTKLKRVKIVETLGYKNDVINFNSNLFENTSFNSSKNEQKYSTRNIFSNTEFRLDYKKWSFKTNIGFSALKQNLEKEHVSESQNSFLPENNSMISYVLNPKNIFRLSYEFQQKPFTENYFYENLIRTSYNNMQRNSYALEIQKSNSVTFNYWYDDIERQFLISTSLSYGQEKGQYFSNITLNNTMIAGIYFYSPQTNDRITHFLSATKFIYPLKTKVRLNSFYIKSNFQNVVNSEYRNIQMENANISLNFKTGFSSKISFENEITFGFLKFKTENEMRNTSIQNKFTFVYFPFKNIAFINEYYTYLPNKSKKTTFNFYDVTLRYLPIKSKISFSISARNIFNVKNYTNTYTTDYSQVIQSMPLLPFHFNFGGGFRF